MAERKTNEIIEQQRNNQHYCQRNCYESNDFFFRYRGLVIRIIIVIHGYLLSFYNASNMSARRFAESARALMPSKMFDSSYFAR